MMPALDSINFVVSVSVDGMIYSCQSMFHDSSYDTAVIVFINETVVGL